VLYKYKPSKQNAKVLNFYGIVSIILGTIASVFLAILELYDIGVVFFPIGLLIGLRSYRSGSKYGLMGLIINTVGTVIIYGQIVLALLLPNYIF